MVPLLRSGMKLILSENYNLPNLSYYCAKLRSLLSCFTATTLQRIKDKAIVRGEATFQNSFLFVTSKSTVFNVFICFDRDFYLAKWLRSLTQRGKSHRTTVKRWNPTKKKKAKTKQKSYMLAISIFFYLRKMYRNAKIWSVESARNS